ncbi:hypothetical protein PENFLA_c012G03497 [Penicillium flavigenum]|uniref:Uncharacterized protein n=1 Tax=Penicillium flavigenum TaxID=254877 RepID=A0A1V6T9S6_9EURO|nr:hypothetical protein PENFLA_c012G03497 [Penicillium flavigenum]
MAFPRQFGWLARPPPFATPRQPRLSSSNKGRLVTYNITSEMQCPLFDRFRWCFELDFMWGSQSTWGLHDQHRTDDGDLYPREDELALKPSSDCGTQSSPENPRNPEKQMDKPNLDHYIR